MSLQYFKARLFGKMKNRQSQNSGRERGQSLVEMALFAPIFVIMLAGLVEIGQYTVTQNRMSTASRSAARFAANGGQNEGMVIVAHNAITKTARISTDPNLWDMWVIRARVDSVSGTSFDEWEAEHIFGNMVTRRYLETQNHIDAAPNGIQDEILDELKAENREVRGLRIVAALILYDSDSILGINNLWERPYTTRSLNILRITGLNLEQTNGCAAFPIAIRSDVVSVNNLPTGGYIYPTGRIPSAGDFPLHEGGLSLTDSREGVVFVLNDAQISWLAWNKFRTTDVDVGRSLAWPGNSLDYATQLPPNQLGYIEPTDNTDMSLHIGDEVALVNGASINNLHVTNQLQPFVDKGRTMRIIIWDAAGGARIGSFAIFRVHGYGTGWLTAEFLRIDESCGQVISGP